MSERIPVKKSLRFEVFKRDRFACQYCGATPPGALLEVDHIHPVAEGGDNGIDNLITACEACNRGKGARLLSSIPISLADKAELVAEKEEQIAGFEAIMRAKRERLDGDAWDIAEAWMSEYGADFISKADLRSIRNFVEKLGKETVLDAANTAAARFDWSQSRGFKYFCGTCWGILKERQQ
ncbi:HNH endonuclease [Labrys portucalensis]|uniref:HNH endonuclease n=1 Tax=Labrys neptuniae TaxID=376174 RepID=A0ABV6Z997_9HYPH